MKIPDLGERAGLVRLVRQRGVPGPTVDRGNAELGESRDVGPSEFRRGSPRARLVQDLAEPLEFRVIHARSRTGGAVGHLDLHVQIGENIAHVFLGLHRAAVRGETEVHDRRRRIRD